MRRGRADRGIFLRPELLFYVKSRIGFGPLLRGRRRAATIVPAKSKRRVRVMARWVYSFRPGAADGAASMRDLLGVKGANLA